MFEECSHIIPAAGRGILLAYVNIHDRQPPIRPMEGSFHSSAFGHRSIRSKDLVSAGLRVSNNVQTLPPFSSRAKSGALRHWKSRYLWWRDRNGLYTLNEICTLLQLRVNTLATIDQIMHRLSIFMYRYPTGPFSRGSYTCQILRQI
ncbi:uncharacterized protein ARMOST_02621 [Armillaria ostoyae]|uniref:Uncharacterized protein n=1 Tax=Armillaria ostoyae TaxID=47428 RepID=A0A284QS65_ARMOS|nr:uncharacterized protein ARMOST_02621 [Armillaria ostoyae]